MKGSSGSGSLSGETNVGAAYKILGTAGAAGTAAFTITPTASNPAWRAFTIAVSPATIINSAPDQPVALAPLDGSTGIGTSPGLEVTVSDPEADAMDVTFYGRAAGTGAPGGDFTIIVLPDTQNAAASYPAIFNSQTQWIADNQVASNIVFVTHTGDIVNTAGSATEWQRADAAMDILDGAGVPYSVGPGNHDLGTNYTDTFGSSRFSGKSWYGGYYEANNYNNYSLISASGMDFIIINLQYNAGSAVLEWADGLLKANTGRRGIVVQHDMLNVNDTWLNQNTYNSLKDNPNLFLMLCGHMHTASDGSAYRTEPGDDGHTIHVMQQDYQDFPNGGNGYLRALRFSPADNKIYATTYSPYIDTFIATSPEQMEMAYSMGGNPAFETLGTVNGVNSGNNAFITWPGLAPDTEYEWYVEVSDGNRTTTGPAWSFTTEAAGEPPDEYELTVNVTGSGTVTRNPDQASYEAGTPVTLTAVPETGWSFTGWSGDLGGNTNPETIVMDGNKTLTAAFTDLSIHAARVLPETVGENTVFEVTIGFTAPDNDFNSIGLTDMVPAGWIISANTTWCTPAADAAQTGNDTVEYVWLDTFPAGTVFTAVYKVTVPAGVIPGTYTFPDGEIEYYITDAGPFKSTITGDDEVAFGGSISGQIAEADGTPLPGAAVELYLGGVLKSTVISGQDGRYELELTEAGDYSLAVSAAGFKNEEQDISIPSAGDKYTLNFTGNHGLIPQSPDLSYVLDCANKWLYPPAEHLELALSISKVLAVVNAWLSI
jgi:uncharacterized repeat protein (TIGR02543 family)